MSTEDKYYLIENIYRLILRRMPNKEEIEQHIAAELSQKEYEDAFFEIILSILMSQEYKEKFCIDEKEIEYVINGFYQIILRRRPDGDGRTAWTKFVLNSADYMESIGMVIKAFLASPEYYGIAFNELPLKEIDAMLSFLNASSKVAIYGTGSESRDLFLILKNSKDFIGTIECFASPILDGDAEMFYGLSVKNVYEMDSQIIILIPDSFIPDKFFYEYINSVDRRNKIIKCNISRYEIILPDAENQIDSFQFYELLDEKFVICSDKIGLFGLKLWSAIHEMNSMFWLGFRRKIHLKQIAYLNNIQELYSSKKNNTCKIFIACDGDYADALDALLKIGFSISELRIVKVKNKSEFNYKAWDINSNFILVCTSGKVGSTTIMTTLKTYGIPAKITHDIVVDSSKSLGGGVIKNKYINDKSRIKIDWLYFTDTIKINKFLSENLHKRKLYIITAVRDPAAQVISKYFQDEERKSVFYKTNNRDVSISDLIEEIHQIFKDFYLDIVNWYRENFREALSLNIYDYQFETAKGYQIIDNNDTRVLVLRLEDMDRVWSKAIIEFLGEERLSGVETCLYRANITSKKSVPELYKEVLSKITFDDKLLNDVYSTEYVRHFYSESEIEAFRRRWTANS